MNRHDRTGPAGYYGLLHSPGIQQQRCRVDIHADNPEPAIERRAGAGDKGEIGHDHLAAVIEAVVIEQCGKGNAQGIGAVGQENAVPTAAIRRPLPGKFHCQRLRQAFDAVEEEPTKLSLQAAVPKQEIAIVDFCPGPQSRISHRFAAMFGQLPGETGLRLRQLAEGGLRHPARQRLGLGGKPGPDRSHDVHGSPRFGFIMKAAAAPIRTMMRFMVTRLIAKLARRHNRMTIALLAHQMAGAGLPLRYPYKESELGRISRGKARKRGRPREPAQQASEKSPQCVAERRRPGGQALPLAERDRRGSAPMQLRQLLRSDEERAVGLADLFLFMNVCRIRQTRTPKPRRK